MNPGIKADAFTYTSISSLEQQLQELPQNEQQDQLPAIDDHGRLVTIASPSLWSTMSGFFGSTASNQPIQDDISRFIASGRKLMEELDLVDRTIEKADLAEIGSLSVKGLSGKLEELLTSPSGLLLMTQEHLEELLVKTLNQTNNPEETLRFCHDELQTCHSRFLAAMDETVDIQSAHAQFNKVINDWLSTKGKGLQEDPQAREAFNLVHERCCSFLEMSGRKVIHITRPVSPPPATQAVSEAPDTRKTAASTIRHQVAQNQVAIGTMTIPETYPKAKDMLLSDLDYAHEQFMKELEALEDGQPARKWLDSRMKQLQKMRETMYYAVRSKDKKPPHHAGRIGLRNQRIDCEPNSHAQAFAHLNCYDYFLHRVYPVCEMPPEEEPVIDRSALDDIGAERTELDQQYDQISEEMETRDPYSDANWGNPDTEQLKQKHRELEKKKSEISGKLYRLDDEHRQLKRQLDDDQAMAINQWHSKKERHGKDLLMPPLQQHWRQVFHSLRHPPEGVHALTLHKEGEGSVYRAEGFPDGQDIGKDSLVPEEYRAHRIELNPSRPETLKTILNKNAKVFVSGGYGHWTCFLVNETGGVDHMNDSTVTRNRYPSREALLEHYNDKERYKKMQLTAIYE